MDRESFSFVIFMIHACADRWKKLSPEVYKLFQRANCIEEYLLPFYDVLHTQGEKYLVDDLEAYLAKRGVQFKRYTTRKGHGYILWQQIGGYDQ